MTGKDLLEGLHFVDEDLIEEAGKETLSAETTEEKIRSVESNEEKMRSVELTEERMQNEEKSEKELEKKLEKKSKSGNRSGKVIFLRIAISAAAGLLIFAAGTAIGSRMAVKPLHSETTTYTLPEDGQNDENEHAPAQGAQPEDQIMESQPEGVAVLGVYQGEDEQNTSYNGEVPVQEGMVGVQAENSDIDTLSLSEEVKVGRKIASSQSQQVQGGHLPQMPATVIGGISVYFYQEENTEDRFFADFEQNNVSYTLQADTLREVVQAAADTICGTGVITIVE